MTASGPSKVVVLDPDARASRQVQLGFEREGIATVAPSVPTDLDALELGLGHGDAPGLALVGGRDIGLVRRTRALLASGRADVPILCTGRGASASEALAAGADAVVSHPAYLRDVVTLGRILRDVPRDHRDHLVGSLVDTSGVYALARALCALGRSAVLTMIRGLRRGEIRFYRGEVTSAQVGLIHGQAAFHQLLLWTDARFDFAYEDIVRRAQIPMSANELFADAERFLESVRGSAPRLSPAMVLEIDLQRVQGLGAQVPTEVHGVLRMFDGHRVLADILEDSPYRVFETLRVAQKAVEAGLLRPIAAQRLRPSWRALLAIEEWLVDSDPKRDRSPSPPGPLSIDWGALVPRAIGVEVGSLSGVVPATDAHGEIEVATRSRELGIEPKVVVDEDAPPPVNVITMEIENEPPAPGPEAERDGPPVTAVRGEILAAAPSDAQVTQGPSILVDAGPADGPSPAASDPATLVSDLAAAHAAIAAATARAAIAPSPGDAASPSRDLIVSEVRKDAVAFTQEEEAFFSAPDARAHLPSIAKPDSFDDLDVGYEPPRFWDRVFGRKHKPRA